MRQIKHACLERAIVFIFFALVVLTSCQDQPEQAVAPEPAVVSVPITAKKEAVTPPKQETAISLKGETVIAGTQEAVILTKQEIPMAANRETAKSTLKDAAPPEKPAVSSPLSQPEEKPLVTEPAQPQFYSAKGKIDPFLPLIRTEQKAVVGTDAREKKPQRVLTPLEKLDLSQIRLVAVVLAESGNIAMVEEISGKGYVVRIGTYIGKNEGRVEKILTNRIVIKEVVKNFRGDAVLRSREMKLHKQELEG
jgi:type IV pilus assembly protein PilP